MTPSTAIAAGWLVLVVLLVGPSAAAKTNNPTVDDVDDYVPFEGERFSVFDWGLLQTLVGSNKDKNLLISPISLKLAMLMLYEGAQDQTAYELATVMRLPVGRFATRDKFSSIIKSLQTRQPEFELSLGTRVFMDRSMVPRQRYCAILKSFYDTDVVVTNFSDGRASSELVNAFVRNVTNGHIDRIVDADASLKDNVMMVTSGMFFKGTWYRQPFNSSHTRLDKFYTCDGKTVVQAPMMRANGRFYYAYSNELEAKILRLPYLGHKYSMFVVLPTTRGKLDEVVKKINPFIINQNLWLMQEVSVDVILPKFKFSFTSHLEGTLRKMGIRDIFDDTATLTGILKSKDTSRRLVVSDIVQKVGIEVNEKGTVASTATKIELGNKMNDETFHANSPFLFYVEDETSGSILYMGVVNNPLEETGMAEPERSTEMPGKIPTRFGEPGDVAPAALGSGTSDRQNFFSVELLQALNDAEEGNVVVGASGVKAALALLAEAAAGRTRQQIASSLRLQPSEPQSVRELAGSSFKDHGTELHTATKLWLAKEVLVKKNYTDALSHYYKSELQALNFFDTGSAMKSINDWVRKHTYDRISSIVDGSSLRPDTRVLLTSAVYFKGTWRNAFDRTATRYRCFNVPKLGCKDVPMMESIANYKYAEVATLDAQVLLLPYSGERVAMLVILPRRSGSQAIADLSRDLSFTPVSAILANLKETEVLLQLPRFTASTKIDLSDSLRKLGIDDLFNDKSDLSSAFTSPVKVGSVVHNAQIDVNEEGTIAAAATGVEVIPLMGQTSTNFFADRPFVFFIIDQKTNSILFAGRYVKPDTPAKLLARTSGRK